MGQGPLTRPIADPAGTGWLRRAVGVVLAISMMGAVGVLVINTVRTTSGRVAATTSSDGLLGAGTVVLSRPDDAARLVFDADDLYPGRLVSGCLELEYAGSVPVEVRLSGDVRGGTGLERYVGLTLTVFPADSCAAVPAVIDPSSLDPPVFDDRLSVLPDERAANTAGTLVAAMEPGERVVVHAVAVVVDDNRAQGRTTDFVMTFEARPS